MYKIYINDNALSITDGNHVYRSDSQEVIRLPYLGGKKMLLNCIDKLEKSIEPVAMEIYSEDIQLLWSDFRSLFKKVKAAGGVILKDGGLILFIERLDRWDLPKGKRDEGESNRETAIREVEEETGLVCEVIESLGSTLHTYRIHHGKRVLKKTKWYLMDVKRGEVKVQEEEHITSHMWMTADKFLQSDLITYGSITEVIQRSVDQNATF